MLVNHSIRVQCPMLWALILLSSVLTCCSNFSVVSETMFLETAEMIFHLLFYIQTVIFNSDIKAQQFYSITVNKNV